VDVRVNGCEIPKEAICQRICPKKSPICGDSPSTDYRRRYVEFSGESTRSGNQSWLLKRIAWRLQALDEGGLSERARRRAEELACDADLRLAAPRSANAARAIRSDQAKTRDLDPRIPMPGSVLSRPYKGRTCLVRVLSDGFEFDNRIYKSLSAVAKAITGTHCNGFLFFGL
jgi:hypothetical protein